MTTTDEIWQPTLLERILEEIAPEFGFQPGAISAKHTQMLNGQSSVCQHPSNIFSSGLVLSTFLDNIELRGGCWDNNYDYKVLGVWNPAQDLLSTKIRTEIASEVETYLTSSHRQFCEYIKSKTIMITNKPLVHGMFRSYKAMLNENMYILSVGVQQPTLVMMVRINGKSWEQITERGYSTGYIQYWYEKTKP